MAKLEALASRRRAVLRLSVHESTSKVNRSSGDAQVVSCHRYLVVFHLFVEQLTVFHTSGLVLSSSFFRVLDLDLYAIARWHPERHVPKVRKLCINQYISIVNPLRTDHRRRNQGGTGARAPKFSVCSIYVLYYKVIYYILCPPNQKVFPTPLQTYIHTYIHTYKHNLRLRPH